MHTSFIKMVAPKYKIIFLAVFFLLFSAAYTHAQAPTFSPLVGIPGVTDAKSATLPEYINAIYMVLIGLGSLVAVMRIAWIGAKYSLSESVVHKVDAKGEITGVLTGLAILLIPFIVLNTINPELTSLDVLRSAQKTTLTTATALTTAQEADKVKCQNKGLSYSVSKGDCDQTTTEDDNIRESKRLCEGYNSGNVFTPPNTCANGLVTRTAPTSIMSCASFCPAGTHYDKNSIAVNGCAKN
jgi:hypothetical protein